MATKDISDEQVCKAYNEGRKAGIRPYDLLELWTGQPFKVCYRAMERASKRGLIDCGVSLRTGWLTVKGKALIGIN